MAIKEIVQVGDVHLEKISEEVQFINDDILNLIKDLKDTLATVEGVGLAAPQIAVNKRVVYIDLRMGDQPIVLVNPEIVYMSKETEKDYEGCLSYINHEGLVERPKSIVVEALNEKGEKLRYEVSDFLARCFCHEIDHLDGIMYIAKAEEMYELVEE